MKKFYTSVLSCLLLFSVLSEADARITKVEESEPMKMKREVNAWSCTDLGAAYHNSQPQGFTCNSFKTHGRICYNNCYSNCNSNNYPYTSAANCEADGGVVGSSCEYNGTTRYKCSCPSSYIDCISPKTGSGGHCTVNGQNKYAGCECPSEYQYNANNCSGTLSGHVCDEKYTQCTPSQPECTPYPYTSANCASPKVLGGNTCNNTYETCTCPSNYVVCNNNSNGDGIACTENSTNKYVSCSCDNNVYPYTSCPAGQTLSGNSCTDSNEVVHYSTCVANNNCTNIGYNQEASSYNAGSTINGYSGINGSCGSGYQTGAMSLCPYDQTKAKWACKSCADLSYNKSLSECQSSCGTCVECPYNTGKYKGTNCEVTCSAGKVLYSNNKCYNGGQTLADGSKPVGVMISNNLAIDLEENTTNSPLLSWPGGVNCHGTGAQWIGHTSTYNSKLRDYEFYNYSNPVQGYNCTKNYCSHLSQYPGKWFLPSKEDIVTLRNNISQYISGMAAAGKSSSVTSANDAKIVGIAIRSLRSMGQCSCPRYDKGCTDTRGPASQGGSWGTKWNGGYVSLNNYSLDEASYRRCMRTVNQSGVSWNVTTCTGASTNYLSSLCIENGCLEDVLEGEEAETTKIKIDKVDSTIGM